MIRYRYFPLFSILFFGLFSAQESYNSLMYQGNTAFNNKNYESSSSQFSDASKIKSNDFASHYNLGNALYKRKLYEESRAEFEKAQQLSKSLPDKTAALYNLGNTLMQANKPDQAAEFYKKALKQDPYNEKVRKNFEIAMLKDKEQKNKQNQSGKSGGGQGDNKDKDKNGDKKQQGSQNGNGQDPNNKGENGDQQKQENKQDKGNSLPKDLEKAILNRVGNKERETAKRILNKNGYSTPESNEKDW